MKKWIAAILMMLMLMQALPLNALATIGNVLTEDELIAAYALTGFGEGGTQKHTGTVLCVDRRVLSVLKLVRVRINAARE